MKMLKKGFKGRKKKKKDRKNVWAVMIILLMVLGFGRLDCRAQETGEITEQEINRELEQLEKLDPENCSDDEITQAVQAASVPACARWLSEMKYEDFIALVKRDTWLSKESITTEYVPAEVTETDETVCLEQGQTTVTKYYQFVLDSCGLPAPVKYRAERASSYFASDSGYFYAYFQEEGTQTASATVKITGISTTKQINTDKASQSQQNNLNVQVTVTGKYPEGFSGNFGSTSSTRADSKTGYYTNIWMPFGYSKQAGYSVSIGTTGEYGLTGDFYAEENGQITGGDQNYDKKADHSLLMKVHIGYHAGVGTSASKHTSHAAFLFNVVPSTYYVTYDGNGATSGATALQTCRYGERCFYQKNGFAREFKVDYKSEGGVLQRSSDRAVSRFKGWSDNKTVVRFEEESAFCNLTSTNLASVTRYAVWEPGNITLPRAFRTGYEFAGWRWGEELLDAESLFTPEKPESMTAEWKPNEYEIAFYRDKETEEPVRVQKFVYDEAACLISAEAMNLVRDGYRFEGWESEKGIYQDGVSVINVTDKKDDVIKFYALWQRVENGGGNDPAGQSGQTETNKKNSYGLTEKQVIEILKRLQNGNLEKLTIEKTEYTIVKQKDGTLEIKVVDTKGQSRITIPSSVTLGDKVFHITAISDGAFKGNATVKEIYVSSGIIKIGNYAFYQCKNLEKAELPDTVMQIGIYAFSKCPNLKQVRFSKGCYEMGEGCFAQDSALKSIDLSGKLIRISAKCFYQCTKLKKAVMGSEVTAIGKSAFEGCKSLGGIKITRKVQSIGKKAFYNCKKLKKVTFRTNGLRKIGSKSFVKCHNKIQFIVNASVKEKYTGLLRGKY